MHVRVFFQCALQSCSSVTIFRLFFSLCHVLLANYQPVMSVLTWLLFSSHTPCTCLCALYRWVPLQTSGLLVSFSGRSSPSKSLMPIWDGGHSFWQAGGESCICLCPPIRPLSLRRYDFSVLDSLRFHNCISLVICGTTSSPVSVWGGFFFSFLFSFLFRCLPTAGFLHPPIAQQPVSCSRGLKSSK